MIHCYEKIPRQWVDLICGSRYTYDSGLQQHEIFRPAHFGKIYRSPLKPFNKNLTQF